MRLKDFVKNGEPSSRSGDYLALAMANNTNIQVQYL